MKMKPIVLVSIVSSLFLVACGESDEEREKILKDDEYQVKELRFEKEKGFMFDNFSMFIDTEQETFVLNPGEADFIKTEEPGTTINIKVIDHPKFGELTETTISINENEVSEISKEYAAEFKETLEFTDNKEK
jgi:hypothetical protein